MLVLKTAEVTNEKKVAEVRALLHNLAEMQRSMRNDSYADKQRLSDESERLSREVKKKQVQTLLKPYHCLGYMTICVYIVSY